MFFLANISLYLCTVVSIQAKGSHSQCPHPHLSLTMQFKNKNKLYHPWHMYFMPTVRYSIHQFMWLPLSSLDRVWYDSELQGNPNSITLRYNWTSIIQTPINQTFQLPRLFSPVPFFLGVLISVSVKSLLMTQPFVYLFFVCFRVQVMLLVQDLGKWRTEKTVTKQSNNFIYQNWLVVITCLDNWKKTRFPQTVSIR